MVTNTTKTTCVDVKKRRRQHVSKAGAKMLLSMEIMVVLLIKCKTYTLINDKLP